MPLGGAKRTKSSRWSMPSPSCWSASDTPTRSIDAANGPSVSENPPRMSRDTLGLRHQLQLEELDGEHAEQRRRHRQVDPQPGAALEVDARGRAAHERDLERHLDVAAGQLAQERIALAERDHQLAVADRQPEGGFLTRDLDAVGERCRSRVGSRRSCRRRAPACPSAARGWGCPRGRWPRPCRARHPRGSSA